MKIKSTNKKASVVFVSVVLAGGFFASGAALAESGFDPSGCARIQNVALPFEVSVNDSELIFSGANIIKISDAGIEIDGATYSDRKRSAALHRDLRQFLGSAAETAAVSTEFGAEDWESFGEKLSDEEFMDKIPDGFLEAITNMCQAILELDASQSAVASSFSAFVAPVEIELSQ